MKDFLCWWITLQLMFIGFALSSAEAELDSKTFKCNPHGRSYWVGGVFPLIYFLQVEDFNSKIKAYCEAERK